MCLSINNYENALEIAVSEANGTKIKEAWTLVGG